MGAQAESGRWNVFFHDPERPWPDIPHPAARKAASRRVEWASAHDAVSGHPFLLGPDGRPDRRINGFFESRQVRALDPDTWRKYAYALGIWLNFLLGRQTSWDNAAPEDVEAFKYWRMADDRNPARVSAGTFAGNLAALNTFYVWAARLHRVANPVVVREVSSRAGRPAVEELAAGPSGIRDRDVKWFDPAGYRRWRDVGLRGFNLDGQEDPSWRGRNEQRDAAFADGLYETGLRLQEWASVLDIELPPDDAQRGFATCWLADVCAKGRVGRRYWMPRGALTAVLAYFEGPRAKAVRRARQEGRYEQVPGLQIVERVHANRRVVLRAVDGKRRTVSLNVLTPSARRRLFRVADGDLEPLAVWLNENGLPRDPHGWEHTFEAANERIEGLGLTGFRGTPHMLRHSFALKWFSVGRLLYEARFAHLSSEELRDFRSQFGDTWQLVQLLLGHSSVTTTMNVYLEPFRALDVELLLEHAAGVPVAELLAALYREHPKVRSDPLGGGGK